MMQEICPDIYHFPIPLPGSPLKELNGYIIKGKDRNLIVDTGFRMEICEKAVRDAIECLGLDMEKTDVFLTHLHADHTGLADQLKNPRNCVYMSAADSRYFKGFLALAYWENLMSMQKIMGFPKQQELHYEDHPGYKNRHKRLVELALINPGDVLTVGEYQFEVLDLKGHTPGQVGLYDAEKGVLFCGDHILNKITPNIAVWDIQLDSLHDYLEGLEMVRGLPVKHLFSAHRALITDVQQRIEQIQQHHQKRLAEAAAAIQEESTVYQVAGKVPWDFGTGEFLEFPAPQKWFAALEMFAHLQYLYNRGEAGRREDKGVFFYRAY